MLSEVRMAIEDLLSVVAPPGSPTERGDTPRWEELQRTLGIALPTDYRDFGMHYGTGHFEDPGRLLIDVWNPFSASHLQRVKRLCAEMRSQRGLRANANVPYGIFPSHPGWLPWGNDIDGNLLCWLTEGEPNTWPLILWIPTRAGFQQLAVSLTSFLAGAFKRQLQLLLWDPSVFFTGPDPVRFLPARH
jgi:cell wall assembly regulator SMI1